MSAGTLSSLSAAPEFEVAGWLNAKGPVSLAALRGKVVAVYAFQMLCPGCVSHGLPQAKRLRQTFARDEVEVLGLHSVFEHHAVMTPAALQVFLHEYRIDFPVGIDQPSPTGPVPLTMANYQLRGTPTLLLFDRQGVLRHSLFGMVDDMQAGALVARLVAETPAMSTTPGCDDGACLITKESA
jgi:peroxiredoxin